MKNKHNSERPRKSTGRTLRELAKCRPKRKPFVGAIRGLRVFDYALLSKWVPHAAGGVQSVNYVFFAAALESSNLLCFRDARAVKSRPGRLGRFCSLAKVAILCSCQDGTQ